MTTEMLFVFSVLVITMALFVWDKWRMDLVALLVVVTLALSGIISPAEAVSGFGNPVVLTIAALFVVGEGLYRAGVAAAVGNWLLRVGGRSETRLLLFLLPVVAILSAFMSSTGAVALLIPVVLSMARKSGMNPSRLFMPLAFAALIGGMLTLIGTPPNIIVSGQMRDAGLDPFRFFDFTPIGLAILVFGGAYLVFVAPLLLPKSSGTEAEAGHPGLREFAERYELGQQLHKLRVSRGSDFIGRTPVELKLRTEYEVTLFGVQRQGTFLPSLLPVLANTRLEPGDTIMVYGHDENLKQLVERYELVRQPMTEREELRLRDHFGLAEVLIPPDSSLASHTLKEGRFRERFGLSVIGVRRQHEALSTRYAETPLLAGDTLLLAGGWQHIRKLENHRELVVLQTPAELQEVAANRDRMPHAIVIVLVMLVVMTFGWLPTLSAALLAALAMVSSRCVSLTEAYQSLNATSLVLIAGMLPLALAMESSGALALVVDNIVGRYADVGPLVLCAGLFLLTSILSQFISNTATTVLVAPIALSSAHLLGLNPEPFMMTVAIAASTAFATPIASPVNTLVVTPGNYRFSDFAKVGVPLQLLALIITLVLTPVIFPF
ncbi:MAG: SLC13 family permease [Saccharospirillum sp.]|nr:SLC13 family permease [Saccharospirillum sp.]